MTYQVSIAAARSLRPGVREFGCGFWFNSPAKVLLSHQPERESWGSDLQVFFFDYFGRESHQSWWVRECVCVGIQRGLTRT